MKKSLVLGMLGLAALAAPSFGQGYIWLDNYNSRNGEGGPIFTYGVGMPANGVSGALGALGTGLNSAWTVGIYWAPGTINLWQLPGWDMPLSPLVLATGPGSTAQVAGWEAGGEPGYYSSLLPFDSGSTTTPR